MKSLHSCWTLCDPMDCSPPGSSVHGILQAGIVEWVAIPSPGDLPSPGIKPRSPALIADFLPSEPPGNNSIWNHTHLQRWKLLRNQLGSFIGSSRCFGKKWETNTNNPRRRRKRIYVRSSQNCVKISSWVQWLWERNNNNITKISKLKLRRGMNY